MPPTDIGHVTIRLPIGDKDPLRLEAQIRNGILSLMDITCPVHGPNTSLDAVVGERTDEHIVVDLDACCEACAKRGEQAILRCAST